MLSPEGKMGMKTRNKRLSDDDDAAGEEPICDGHGRDRHGEHSEGKKGDLTSGSSD